MSLPRPRLSLILAGTAAVVFGLSACSSVMDLDVGDCFDSEELSGDEVESVSTIDCSEEHDSEVYAEYEFDDGDFPGDDEVEQQGGEYCVEEFESFIGVPYEQSEIYLTALNPSEQSWDDADDRTTLCIAENPDALTESMADADR